MNHNLFPRLRSTFAFMLILFLSVGNQSGQATQTSPIQGIESVPANCLQHPRVLVSTDAGGTDPDDLQSLVHLFVYADCFDIEGIVSSPWGKGRKEHIIEVIDLYERDYPNLKTYSDRYPTSDALRAVVKQGAVETSPEAGFATSTEGSAWIIKCARRNDPRPLHVLVWGGIDDLAQALHDAPDILPKLRVYWIGGPNKKYSQSAYNYIRQNHLNLWIIEANTTYRGWFWGGNQEGQWDNNEFVAQHVTGHGALGEFFAPLLKGRLKMGDTPSVAWLLKGDPEDPTQPSWGGKFVHVEDAASRPNWWTDDPDPAVLGMRKQRRKYEGALTVSQWREDFLGDFAARMDRCKTPSAQLLTHEDTTPLDLLLQYTPADEELAEKYKHYLTQELGVLIYGIKGTGTARTITKTIVVPPNVTYDGKGEVLTADTKAMGADMGEQSEKQRPLFLLAPGAGIKNVTITDPGCEGIHLMGDNVLDNIHWEDVGEDAASVRSYFPGGKITIKNSKAFKASDKMFQFNTSCSVSIENFVGDGMGKLVRHMGSQDVPFNIDLNNVTVTNVVNAIVQSGSRKCYVRYHNLSYKFKGDKDRPERVFRKIPPENVTEY